MAETPQNTSPPENTAAQPPPNPRDRAAYKRVRGTMRGFVSSRRLYLGPDHILVTTQDIASESFRRFYFQDIQAVALIRTSSSSVNMALLLCLGAAFIAMGFVADTVYALEGVAIVVCSIIGAILGIFGLAEWVRGPSCHCYIRTPVHHEHLASLSRWRSARAFVRQVAAAAAAAQGTLDADEVQSRVHELPAGLGMPLNDNRIVRPTLYWAMLVCLFVNLVLGLALLAFGGIMLWAVTVVAFGIAAAFTLAVFVIQATRATPAQIAWAPVLSMVILIIWGIAVGFVILVEQTAAIGPSAAFFSEPAMEQPALLVLIATGCLALLVIEIAGVRCVYRQNLVWEMQSRATASPQRSATDLATGSAND